MSPNSVILSKINPKLNGSLFRFPSSDKVRIGSIKLMPRASRIEVTKVAKIKKNPSILFDCGKKLNALVIKPFLLIFNFLSIF